MDRPSDKRYCVRVDEYWPGEPVSQGKCSSSHATNEI